MSLSTLPLSYCTNVHPARSLSDVRNDLARYTAVIGQRTGRPLAAGLWLQASVVQELIDQPAQVPELRAELERLGLCCYTLNAFPYGDFHSPRVKDQVYLPDWSDPRRLSYTLQCAQILAGLLPNTADPIEGSISTLPLGFKGFSHTHPPGHQDVCIQALLEATLRLDQLSRETGRLIRLAIEPEPFCLLETTAEAIAFFDRLFQTAEDRGQLAVAQRHLGLCYDVCHQAVEFEDVAESIRQLHAKGIRINKVHITCAIELTNPAENAEGRTALAQYVEQRYLHQTLARRTDGNILRQVDLTGNLALTPSPEFLTADAWRIHFHVPVNLDTLGHGLRTTRAELVKALAEVARLPYAPHLEVETYTWPVLPGTQAESRDEQIIAGLARELISTHDLLK